MSTITMEHSKYSVNITNETTMEYRIARGDKDVTESLDNNFVRDMIYEIAKLREENERLRTAVNAEIANPAIMTSPIGDLTIDSTGMRKAIDTIDALQKKLTHVESAAGYLQYVLNDNEADNT